MKQFLVWLRMQGRRPRGYPRDRIMRTKPSPAASPEPAAYEQELHERQVALVKPQEHLIARSDRILVIFEGRDVVGKDGRIKRTVQHLSPRETCVVALGRPFD
jgi:polyphosphate kinase